MMGDFGVLFIAVLVLLGATAVLGMVRVGIQMAIGGLQMGLFRAARKDNTKKIRELAKKGGNLNKSNFGGRSALGYAIENNNLQAVRALIHGGAEVNEAERAMWGIESWANHPISGGKEAEEVIRAGFYPIHYASRSGNLDIVELLLGKGADPNSRSLFGYTPLQCVATVDIKNALIRGGAQKA